MNSEQFVDIIKNSVLRTSVDDTLENLADPPGRKVSAEILARSNWFKSLDKDQVNFLKSALHDSAHGAIFGLFAILDGSRNVDDGRFELAHVGDSKTVLNEPQNIGLNELLNAAD